MLNEIRFTSLISEALRACPWDISGENKSVDKGHHKANQVAGILSEVQNGTLCRRSYGGGRLPPKDLTECPDTTFARNIRSDKPPSDKIRLSQQNHSSTTAFSRHYHRITDIYHGSFTRMIIIAVLTYRVG